MSSLRLLVLLSVVSLVGCGGTEPPKDAVTGVSVSGEEQVASEGTVELTAEVTGQGSYASDVVWSIREGDGGLSATTGASVTYTAPFARKESVVTIHAVSQGDASKVGVFRLTVKRAAPALLLAGTYVGTNAYEAKSGDSTSTGSGALTLTVEAVTDTQVRLRGVPNIQEWILLDVLADDSLSFQPNTGTTSTYNKYCHLRHYIGDEVTGETGTGSWDAEQHLTLDWTTILRRACYPIGGGDPNNVRITYTYTANVFTGTKL
jgi:hypothetical protein